LEVGAGPGMFVSAAQATPEWLAPAA
jgi:hypothetical protein